MNERNALAPGPMPGALLYKIGGNRTETLLCR